MRKEDRVILVLVQCAMGAIGEPGVLEGFALNQGKVSEFEIFMWTQRVF